MMIKYSKYNFLALVVASTSLTACSTLGDAYVDAIDKTFAVATFKSEESQDIGKLKKYILREDTKNYVKVIDNVPLDEHLYWNWDNDIKYTALQYAVRWDNEVIAQALINRGANIESTPIGSNTTPLMQATFSGNASLVKILLKAGANPDVTLKNGKMATDYIRPEHNGVAVTKAFLDAGVNVSEAKIAEIQNYAPPRQEKKNSSGFQWGKALALGVGAVAGGGLKLDSDTQANVIAGIVLDSQADTSGTSNLNNAVQSSLETNARRAAASGSLPSSSKSEVTANQSGSSDLNAPNSAPTSDAKATANNSRECLKEAFDLRTRYAILTEYCEGKIEGTTESRGYRHRLVAKPVIMTEWPTAKNLTIKREARANTIQKLRQSLGNIHNGAMAERTISCSSAESFLYQNSTATYEQARNSLSQVQEHHRSRQLSLSEAKERRKNAFTLSEITITPNEMSENQAFQEFERWLGDSNSCEYAERLRKQK